MAVDFIDFYRKKKLKHYCASSGFDCELLIHNLKDSRLVKRINLQQVIAEYTGKQLRVPPHVYSMCTSGKSLHLATESGHIATLNVKN